MGYLNSKSLIRKNKVHICVSSFELFGFDESYSIILMAMINKALETAPS